MESTGAGELGIRVVDAVKRFRRRDGDVVAAVDGVTLDIPRGEFWVLLGPSGCGKTTLLRCIAGLERPDEGSVVLDDRIVFSRERRLDVPTEKRGIGMVFQAYALWPHMSVRSNVAFPLTTRGRKRKHSKTEINTKVREALDLVGIGDLIEQPVGNLSGGQQQRVSLARAIVGGNDVILFDEPLSNVDAKVREQLRVEIRTLQRILGFTALYVTHDQEEAMELADTIAVMAAGKVAQLGSVADIYDSPATRYVAEFVGVANVLVGIIGDAPGPTSVETEIGPVFAASNGSTPKPGEVVVISRAHRWWISATPPRTDRNSWQGRVESISYVGSHLQVLVKVGSQVMKVWADPSISGLTEGADVWVGVDPADCRVLEDA